MKNCKKPFNDSEIFVLMHFYWKLMLRMGGFIPFATPSTAVLAVAGWVDKPSIWRLPIFVGYASRTFSDLRCVEKP